MDSYDYYRTLERNERRYKYFKEKHGGNCLFVVLFFGLIICSPCICIDKLRKVHPQPDDD